VLIKDGIHTLVDIVIIDLIHTNLFSQSCTTQRFATSNIAQSKENKTTITIDTSNIAQIKENKTTITIDALEIFGCIHK
jgi:hypothetical protein